MNNLAVTLSRDDWNVIIGLLGILELTYPKQEQKVIVRALSDKLKEQTGLGLPSYLMEG